MIRLKLERIKDDDCVGTLRRRIRKAIMKQVPTHLRTKALEAARFIRGGVPVSWSPDFAVRVPYNRDMHVVPVNEDGQVFTLTGFGPKVPVPEQTIEVPKELVAWQASREAIHDSVQFCTV